MGKSDTASIPILLVALFCLSSCGQQDEKPQPAPIQQETPAEASIENGLRLIILPSGEAPLISIAARCSAGTDQEAVAEAGFAALLARIIASGGPGSAPERLESLGAALSVDLQPDALTISATVLPEDALGAAGILLDRLSSPPGDEEIMRQRDLLLVLGKSRGEAGTARDVLNAVLFPASPQGFSSADKIDALETLSPEALRSFAEKCLRPERTIIAVVGDVSPSLAAEIRKKAGGWEAPQGSPAIPPFKRRKAIAGPAPVKIVPLRGGDASLFLVRRLPALDPENYYSLLAVNFILNGQSTYGRLTGLQVRSKLLRPLSSTLQLWERGSGQVISAAVAADRAGETVQDLLGELQILHSGKVGNTRLLRQEISDAKNSLRGRLLRRTETTAQLAQFILWSEGYAFPGSGLEDHLRLIDGITKEGLLEIIEQHFQPAFTALIAVGPGALLKKQLSPFGETEIIRP